MNTTTLTIIIVTCCVIAGSFLIERNPDPLVEVLMNRERLNK